jgi:hypothetical protein
MDIMVIIMDLAMMIRDHLPHMRMDGKPDVRMRALNPISLLTGSVSFNASGSNRDRAAFSGTAEE